MVRMIEEAERGNLKALFVLGENPLRALPEPDRVRGALSGLEFLVVQDILATETTEIADVVLPGAAFTEKGGSFTNVEGRIQTFAAVVSPPGDARPDWEILELLAGRMGYSKTYGSPEKIRSEISQLTSLYASFNAPGQAAWINEETGKRLFNPEGKGSLIAFSPVASSGEEPANERYPFTALLGSSRYHLGSGTRTSRSSRIRDIALHGEVEIAPEDGTKWNLQEGSIVRVVSPHGAVVRKVRISKGLRPGLLFIPTAFMDNESRHLVALRRLGDSGSPGLKECAVRIEEV
jgi:predicted molibdopterin-dependent oxidoreductase YjgC